MSRYPPTKTRLCGNCATQYKPGTSSQKYCLTCQPTVRRLQSRQRAARFRLKHPEEAKKAAIESLERYREDYLARKHVYSTRYWNRIRLRVLGHYSNFTYACACCGEKELDFLAVDHVNGGGGKHRRALFGEHRTAEAGSFYHWLINNGFPSGYQILCHNCNWSKGRYDECVHVRRRPPIDNKATILDRWMRPR